MDHFGGRHYPPQPESHQSSTERPRRPRYSAAPDKGGTDGYGSDRLRADDQPERYPRRAQTYRPPPPRSSDSSSVSPPPRREPPRRSPRNHPKSPNAENYHAMNRRRHREEDLSDGRHDRRPPPRERRRERDAPRKGGREAPRRSTRPQPERQESKWQKEGKRFFNEYAVPAIKAEGTKYISKQIGNILAKGVSS